MKKRNAGEKRYFLDSLFALSEKDLIAKASAKRHFRIRSCFAGVSSRRRFFSGILFFVFFQMLISNASALYQVKEDEATVSAVTQNEKEYELRLGLTNTEKTEKEILNQRELSQEVNAEKSRIMLEKEAILKKVMKEKEEAEIRKAAEIQELLTEFEQVQSGEFAKKDMVEQSKGILIFQIGFLLLCLGALFPFLRKSGKFYRSLNDE